MNILVGNRKNPKTVFFCHYDSLGPGATDNAAGTAVLLKLAINSPQTRETCLFVISGNEELSYDQPVYWGHGYRVFERVYTHLLNQAKRLVMVDCVGNGTTTLDHDPEMLRLAFPLSGVDRYLKKMSTLYGNLDRLMEVYHSERDILKTVREEYLRDAVRACLRLAR